MLWQKARDQVTAENLCGPKTLRSSLVAAGADNCKVDIDDLETCELLGHGAYGMVHRVQEKKNGQCRVMKTVVRPEGWDDNKLKLEAELLQNLDHPHILRIFSWYEDGDTVNIVTEHCKGGELVKVVREGRRRGLAATERWLATALQQTFEALVYLHSKGVVHKDLKGQNLLLLNRESGEDGQGLFDIPPHVVICDLGIAEVCCRSIFGMQRGSRIAGTPCTMAPEVWRGSCGPKSDVWSLGCVMFELFANSLPFNVRGGVSAGSRQQEKWLELHRRGPEWTLMQCSPDGLALCKQLLTFREAARPSASEALRHRWFRVAEDSQLSQKEVKSVCEAVLTWHQRNPMQRAMCLKMAVGSTSINKFASIFSKFDTDNSGILDRAEVIAALESLGIERTMAKKVASALDVNGDRACEYLEFVAACLSSLEDQFDELLRQEFHALDRRGVCALSPRELGVLLGELRPLAEAHGLELADIDKNSDGVVSFSEFCEYFGRPGIEYRLADAKGVSTRKTPQKQAIPMKEHIRIMSHSSFEEDRKQFRQRMERGQRSGRPAQLQPPGAARGPGVEAVPEAGQLLSRSPTGSSRGSRSRSRTSEEAKVAASSSGGSVRRRPSGISTQGSTNSTGPAEATRRPPGQAAQTGSPGRPPGDENSTEETPEASPPPPSSRGPPTPDAGGAGGGPAPPGIGAGQVPAPEGGGKRPDVPATQDCVAMLDKHDASPDCGPGLHAPLRHPCRFYVASDNLITFSTAHSPVASFERLEQTPCSSCLPSAAAWLQHRLVDDGVDGWPHAKRLPGEAGEPRPSSGHCVISL
uniref:non-specific serine/threonine protein kinase n=1 Tax=Alexandrium monilatum TaxID=311494 RepID=A0A7S4Q3X3_9DINO